MRFDRKLIVCSAVPAAIFMVAVSTSIWGLMRTQSEFEHYIGVDQKISGGLEEMYAQGLQMGQALRNVLLKPTDAQGFRNLDDAGKQYATVAAETATYARDTPEAATLDALSKLRDEHRSAQQKVLLAIRGNDLPHAGELLVNEETPAWRRLRGELVKDIKRSQAHTEEVRTEAIAHAQNAVRLALVLALAALSSAFAMVRLLTRTVRNEIGGDPDDARTALKGLASGDLATTIALHANDRTSMMASLNAMREHLASLISNIKATAESISGASEEIAESSLNLSQRTEEQAASLEETAASMEQLTTTVKQNADNAREATTLAAAAADIADQCNSVVGQMLATMEDITANSTKIADITALIEGIAFQTNILALNAAVEAARAGEHGRGFAVVAAEVRSLAQRSSNASKDIKTLIQSSAQTVEAGSVHAREVGRFTEEVQQAIRRVAAINGEISTASHEQGTGIEQVNQAIGQMDQVTQQNAALVSEAAGAAQSMNARANQLREAAIVFKVP